jgi:hypothetical protein
MAIQYATVTGDSPTLDYDTDNKLLYYLILRPEPWTTGREVIQDKLLIMPTVANGCMYQCVQGGITGATEPNWTTAKNSIVISGTAKFKSIPYNLLLQTGDVIEANNPASWPAYEFVLPNGLTIDNISVLNSNTVQFRIMTTPGIGEYTIVCRVSVKKVSGIYVRYDIPLKLNVVA